MARPPAYVTRFVRVPNALAMLREHPDGLPLTVLAAGVGASVDDLREELLAFYTADPGAGDVGFGLRAGHLDFLGSQGEEDDPNTALVVRLVDDDDAFAELGVEVFGPDVLLPLIRTAFDLLALEPGNSALESAVGKLGGGLLPGVAALERPGADLATVLRQAAEQRRRVRIRYSRTWHPGSFERVIEPYRVVSTVRGYEVDAGPLDTVGDIRTYLVSGIGCAEPLDEHFEPPSDVAERIERCRRVSVAEFVVPQQARWAVDALADRVDCLDEDSHRVRLSAQLLPPVRDRIGLILVLGGPGCRVVAPPEHADAGRELARALLAHHDLM